MRGDRLLSRPLHHRSGWEAGPLPISEQNKPIGIGLTGLDQRGRKYLEIVHLADVEVSRDWIRNDIVLPNHPVTL